VQTRTRFKNFQKELGIEAISTNGSEIQRTSGQ
jgi:hypothetical protein